jgi:RNA polymerase sigma-70 factor (ECF subfamily)
LNEIAALLEPQIPGLRRYAWALLRDDEAADDLVQDTLERAIAHWAQRRQDADLRAWLFAIQRNLFISELRRRKRRGSQVDPEILESVPAPDSRPDEAAGLRDILAGLDALPEEQRSVLLLVGVEDLSYEQAARVLGLPIGTVMSRLSRAREKMRRFMDGGRGAVLRRIK